MQAVLCGDEALRPVEASRSTDHVCSPMNHTQTTLAGMGERIQTCSYPRPPFSGALPAAHTRLLFCRVCGSPWRQNNVVTLSALAGLYVRSYRTAFDARQKQATSLWSAVWNSCAWFPTRSATRAIPLFSDLWSCLYGWTRELSVCETARALASCGTPQWFGDIRVVAGDTAQHQGRKIYDWS